MCKDTALSTPPSVDSSDSINANVNVTDSINLDEIPLSALQSTSRDKLSNYLNPPKYLQTSNGSFRDWRGILNLMDLSKEYESTLVSNQTCQLINLVEEHQLDLSMGDFLKMLRQIDRWDVVADILLDFEEDAIEYKKSERPPEQITMLDAELAEQNSPFQKYDAFLLFVDEDLDFALKILENLKIIQDQEVDVSKHLKLCSKLDFLPGINFDHDGIRDFLVKRCDRLIVILTPDFVNSEVNAFLLKVAKHLGLDDDVRRIIPCLYKWCELPEIFHWIHLLNYERSLKFDNCNFWEKLMNSLVAPCPVASSVTNLNSQEETIILTSLLVAQEAVKRRSRFLRGLKSTRKFARRILI